MTLEIKAFFFNAQIDYLPYYKNFTVCLEDNDPISKILPLVKEQNREFSFLESNQYFRINSVVLDGSQKASELVDKFGYEMTVEPISMYRCTNGLVINDNDFMQSFGLLSKYATDDDLKFYKSLYPLHYASSSFEYTNDYIGDAILVLANKMVSDEHEYKREILHIIANCDNGLWRCEYENNLFENIDYSSDIANLKQICKDMPDSKFEYKMDAIFAKTYKSKRLDSVANSNIAFYDSNNNNKTRDDAYSEILFKGGKIVEFGKQSQKAGQDLFGTNSRFGAFKSGTMLLDAMDSGANIIMVSDSNDAVMFKKYLGLSVKELQRNIDLEIITRGELANMQKQIVA